jgi:hypothetical protein
MVGLCIDFEALDFSRIHIGQLGSLYILYLDIFFIYFFLKKDYYNNL